MRNCLVSLRGVLQQKEDIVIRQGYWGNGKFGCWIGGSMEGWVGGKMGLQIRVLLVVKSLGVVLVCLYLIESYREL